MKQFRIHKSIMKYLTDKDLSLNAKGFLTIVLFNEELPGIDVAKYCSDNKETISTNVVGSDVDSKPLDNQLALSEDDLDF